ncbi:MAG TPA: hypothetical protein VH590_10960 [Ktedonobacterales bacterium]|jgi:hypothetical protein
MRSWSFSPGWSRFFDLPRGSAFAAAALRRRSLDPASEEWRLVVLAAHLPEAARLELIDGLRAALRLRRHVPEARQRVSFQMSAAETERTRFGCCGEQLCPQPSPAVRRLLREEVQAMLRTLEADLSRPVRNWRLAMHCARLGQLYAELARRRRELVPLEELHQALSALRVVAC